MNKTIESLVISVDNSERIKNKILTNLENSSKKNMVLNLVEIDFYFKEKEVELIYHAVDNDYLNIKLNFDDLKIILTK